MLKKTITYTDYNGVERTEDFYFNLTEAECVELEMGTTGGLSETMKKMVQTQDMPSIIKMFKNIVLNAYGEKSSDGRRFIKSEEISVAFSQTEAYSKLFMELTRNGEQYISDFINGIIPKPANKPDVKLVTD